MFNRGSRHVAAVLAAQSKAALREPVATCGFCGLATRPRLQILCGTPSALCENCRTPMSKNIIEIQGVKKSYHGNPVLRGIDLVVEACELTVLIGPSGCGKSTLLRCLNGLETFDEGRISVNGLSLERGPFHAGASAEDRRIAHEMRRMMGMVFQAFNLFPHMTVLENVARPPRIVQGASPAEARALALDLLDKVGLKEKAPLYPHQLSGGQQQRAAIARALAMKPKVLLLDEPTSALDPGLTDEVLGVMRDLDSEGITQLVVTHEMRFAREAAEKIAFVFEGKVIEEGNPAKIFTDPADARTRQFLKRFL
jgi:polar amino acid transport system ATP-binding protein